MSAETSSGGVKAAKPRATAPLVEATEVAELAHVASQTARTTPATPASQPTPTTSGAAKSAKSQPNATVDTWAHEKLDAAQKSVLEAIRNVVRRVAPQATEAVKWAQPVWERNGPFAFLKPAKDHITVGFWRGAELPDPKGLLEGAGVRMRHLKIRVGTVVPIDAIAKFVRAAVRRNEAGGERNKPRT